MAGNEFNMNIDFLGDDSFEVDDALINGAEPVIIETSDKDKTKDKNKETVGGEPDDVFDLDDFQDEQPDGAEDETQDDQPLEEDEQSSSLYRPLTSLLLERGFLDDEDLEALKDKAENEDYTEEEFTTIWNKQIEKRANELYEVKTRGFTPEAVEFTNLLNQGISADRAMELLSKATTVSKIEVGDLEEDEALCERIVRQYRTAKGVDLEEVDSDIEDWKDADKLVSKAKEFLPKLKALSDKEAADEKQKIKLAEKKRSEDAAKYFEEVKEFVDKTEELIPGVKLTKKLKDELYDKMVTPVEVTKNNVPISIVQREIAKNPHKANMILTYLAMQGVFDGKWDKILSVGESKATEKLKKAVESSNIKGSRVDRSADVNTAKVFDAFERTYGKK